jgi:hypothetical protein
MTRSSRTSSSRSKKNTLVFGPLQYAIIVLTVATALIHFVLAFDFMFILNGLGYLALLGALYLPIAMFDPYRTYIRWVLIGYTALTIVLWAVITGASYSVIGYVTKAIEVALIVALWFEGQQRR